MRLDPRFARLPLTNGLGTLSSLVLPFFLALGCDSGKIVIDDSGPVGGDDTGSPDSDADTDTDTDTDADTDADTDTDTVADGALSVSPSSVDFGLVFVGASGAATVTVSNVGAGAVAVATAIEGDAAYTVVAPTDSPEPGASVDLALSFTPSVYGTITGTLFVSDTLSAASVPVTLTGIAQIDADGDGVGSLESGGLDCDDTAAAAYPGAPEIWYDGIDEDCAGDDDYDRDADGSSYTEDCDDGNANAYPGADELWYDGVDEDCAGDNDFDQDGDSVEIGADCDDTDASVLPGAPDTWYDGIDSDCEGNDDFDQDEDGYDLTSDCNDLDASINPSAADTWYDGIDSDCAGDNDYDQDLDGVEYPTDCNDTDATVTGPVDETLDGLDNDCDGLIDDVSVDTVVDGVLYGNAASVALGDSDSLSFGGDVTGDGLDDLIVSSEYGSGYAWVVTGATAATANGLVDSYDRTAITGSSSYYPLGNVVGPARDVTGDGNGDVLISGNGTLSYSSYAYNGYGWLITGGSSLSTSISTSSTYTARFTGDSDYNDAFTWATSGDIDGDGYDDVVTGCIGDHYSGGWSGSDYYTGNVAIYSGAGFSGTSDMGDSDDQIHGEDDYDSLGASLVVADLDGDGYDDIISGAFGVDDGASNAGAIYVFAGNSSLDWDDRADDAYEAVFYGSGSNDYVGYYPLSAPGDVDGDGSLDLAFATVAGGEAYLWWDAGTLSGSSSVTSADILITGTAAAFGSSVAYNADLDGDGADELYVGDSGDDTVGSNAGVAYRFQPTSASTRAWTTADASARFWGAATGDALGSGLAGGGDADGDGRDDLLIGATGDDGGASNGGAVYVILGE